MTASANFHQLCDTTPDNVASAIAEGATPLDDSGIILAYHGRLYVLPDKDLGAGTMASHTVIKHASAAAN